MTVMPKYAVQNQNNSKGKFKTNRAQAQTKTQALAQDCKDGRKKSKLLGAWILWKGNCHNICFFLL